MHVFINNKKVFLICLLIIIVTALYPEVFRFKYIPESKQRIEATINGKQVLDGKELLTYSQRYKTIRNIIKTANSTGHINDIKYYYNLNKFHNQQILELKDSISVNFTKDAYGNISLFTDSSLITYRNVPVFPENEIKPGDTWEYPGLEVQDIFSDGIISKFPITVKYKFLGYEQLEGKKLAKFEFSHKLDITNNSSYNIHSRLLRVIGESKTIMYFDNINGTRVKEEYSRNYAFLISGIQTNNVYELQDSGTRIWHPVELMDKENIVEELKKKLEDEKIDDADVQKDDKGIKITLENIHFYPDSSEMLEGEETRIKKIAKILKNYKDRGIMIIGHTTDRGTKETRKILSNERAKVVFEYLLKLNAINIDKSSYGGKGGEEPIADNSTEKGMKKNRRVEIFILEE